MLRGKLVEGESEELRDSRGKMCVALDDTSCCFPSTGLILAPIPGAMSPHLQAGKIYLLCNSSALLR